MSPYKFATVPRLPTPEQIEVGAKALIRWHEKEIPDCIDELGLEFAREEVVRVYLAMVNYEPQ